MILASLILLIIPGSQTLNTLIKGQPFWNLISSADENDLLILNFDNSPDGNSGEIPIQASGITYQTGVVNAGINLSTGSLLTYQSAQNIDSREGTIDFWIKPSWNGNDNLNHTILSYGYAGGILIAKDGANNLRMMLNRLGYYSGGEIDVSTNIGSWVSGQWRHVAFTWSNSSKKLRIYVDGQIKNETTLISSLPSLSTTVFQLGGEGTGNYLNGVLDNLRISSIPRSAEEIAARMNSNVSITSWNLNPAHTNIELTTGWKHSNLLNITASSNIGNITLPMLAATWTSNNPAVAVVDSEGWIRGISEGSATLTGLLGSTSRFINVTVKNPILPVDDSPVDPYLATPASGALFRVPVVIIRYFPTNDGVNLDEVETGWKSTLEEVKARSSLIERRHKFMLEEGSRYRGYKNPTATPSLGYEVLKSITVYEKVPRGFAQGTNGPYYPDYKSILSRFNAEYYVNTLGVKEFWLVFYHHGSIVPDESNMSSPITGDISNSYRWNTDQPVYQRTFVTYGINFTGSQTWATHNHGHQLESIYGYINQRQDGNTNLFWNQFARPIRSGYPYGRAGNTHFPPNGTSDYDYNNSTSALSDILDWNPDGGTVSLVNNATWRNLPYQWPANLALHPDEVTETHWYMMWMQTMAGIDNEIVFSNGLKKMTNWWQFTGDWDASIQRGIGLHENSNCNYQLSDTTILVDGNGGSGAIEVSTPSSCRWIASSNYPDWITVTNGGNGPGSVNYTIRPATDSARMGSLVIANQLVKVIQVNPVGAGIYDNTHINWSYSGKWTNSGNLSGAYNRTLSSSNDPNASAMIKIIGSAFRLIFTKNAARGLLGIYVDGVKIADVNANSANQEWQASYQKSGLTNGVHTIEIKHGSGATGALIDVDAIEVNALTDAPSGVTATPYSATQINLNWTDVATNEIGYRVSRRLTSGATWLELATLPANTNTYSNTGLTPSTGYTYRVSTILPGDTLASAADVSATTFAFTTGPTAATATPFSSTRIDLSWNDVATNEMGYRILRRLWSGTSWFDIATLPINATSFQNSGLAVSTKYAYKVCAISPGVAIVLFCSAEIPVTTYGITEAPTSVTATAISATQINLNWTDAASNETGYRIERRLTSDTSTNAMSVVANVAANSTSYQNTGLVPATSYTYRVSAIAPGESLASGADISAATNTLTNIDDQKDLLVLNFDNSLIGENSETPTSANGTTYQAGVTNAGAVL